ncbi:glycosyltransferase [Rhizobium sp. BK377]|uniref:glycosyltransferase family protein n=1 Tax=Rhizobium sp. BK377 TaxID=2587058 RepID=UPI00161A0C94|nr:glycosyltransferase [Rhizobium sp. BK377]MBB3463071.1 hypothetical protein [Rhizobium sp. BK377]
MRIFQNSGLYPAYRRQFDQRHGTRHSFAERRELYLKERFGALHFLLPIIDRDTSGFFTNGDDEVLQRAWATENGMPTNASMSDILLAQIEEHRTEVFYNLDPMRYGSDFIRRLPGSVRHSLAWRAAPSPGADFSAYSRVLNNFPSILESYRKAGWSVEYFAPAHDPVMDKYAGRADRPIDILFVGGYTRHHQKRALILEAIAKLSDRFNVRYHLERSRMTRLAESPLGIWPSLNKYRRPAAIRRVSAAPVFGLDLYEALSRTKIVLNGAIDMSGNDRGNMRCFEAMGCGALLFSDRGNYPDGMRENQNMLLYDDVDDAEIRIKEALDNTENIVRLAKNGRNMVEEVYGKKRQWQRFEEIVSTIKTASR